jgi:hypothetical protein
MARCSHEFRDGKWRVVKYFAVFAEQSFVTQVTSVTHLSHSAVTRTVTELCESTRDSKTSQNGHKVVSCPKYTELPFGVGSQIFRAPWLVKIAEHLGKKNWGSREAITVTTCINFRIEDGCSSGKIDAATKNWNEHGLRKILFLAIVVSYYIEFVPETRRVNQHQVGSRAREWLARR